MQARDHLPPDSVLADRMLVVSAVIHHLWQGRLYGYTPYVREVDAWSHLFGELRIVAPTVGGPPPSDYAPFRSDNVSIVSLPATGGGSFRMKAAQALRTPELAVRIAKQMTWADAIQVRCPSNLGVIAVPLAPLFSKRLHCKYAGMWGAFEGEPWSSRLQRWMLVSPWWRGPVSVYGPAPSDPPKVQASFSTALTEAQLGVPRTDVTPSSDTSIRVVFVGRLSGAKNVDTVIRAMALVRDRDIGCALEVVGDGPMRHELESLVAELELEATVTFTGALPIDEVLGVYRRSDVLILVSESEGWPKAIVEAMAFGVVVIGNDRGLVPTILRDGRGFSVPPGEVDSVAGVIVELAQNPCLLRATAERASDWAGQFSLERFASELRHLLDATWPERATGGATRRGLARR